MESVVFKKKYLQGCFISMKRANAVKINFQFSNKVFTNLW